jgi:Cd2+/Zn2+-exporting ATPase
LLADRVRAEAAETLTRLRTLGITDFVMLTGDRAEVARHIAQQTGITDFHAECLPQDKVERIRELRAQGRRVLVIGDGLNDAPALAEADLGVAMGTLGNDITVHTSDVALMSGDLRRLPDLLVLSARTVGIINQNLLCGFLFIILAITASSLGFVNPVLAAFLHEFSAFFVIFNSARLLRFDGLEDEKAAETPENTPQPVFA